MLIIGTAIIVESGRPAVIRQRRIGRNGVEFRMWKFRTLPQNTPQMAKSELGRDRIQTTRLGRLLRTRSLDELPQLLNVLAGDMSLVGPRPALYTQNDLTALRSQLGVLDARPGMTGLAQVSGREDLPLAEKVAFDAEYVRSMSLRNDAAIALRTLRALLRPRGSF